MTDFAAGLLSGIAIGSVVTAVGLYVAWLYNGWVGRNEDG
jgi:hypothetical protein